VLCVFCESGVRRVLLMARARTLWPPPPPPLSSFSLLPHLAHSLFYTPRADEVVKHLVVEATCSTGGGAQTQSGGTGSVYAQAYVEAGGARKVLVVNKAASSQAVTLAGAAGGAWSYVDESTGFGPYGETTLGADTWQLAPYALGVLRVA
jgi:hypothetical protein